jgi:hypothetical protein
LRLTYDVGCHACSAHYRRTPDRRLHRPHAIAGSCPGTSEAAAGGVSFVERVRSRSGRALGGKIKGKEITAFGRQLSSLIRSGVPILRAIGIISEQSENPVFKKMCKDGTIRIIKRLYMERHWQKFGWNKSIDDEFVSMLRANGLEPLEDYSKFE